MVGVELEAKCVVSAGNNGGVWSKIQIAVKRVSKLNPQNWVSYEMNDSAGAGEP